VRVRESQALEVLPHLAADSSSSFSFSFSSFPFPFPFSSSFPASAAAVAAAVFCRHVPFAAAPPYRRVHLVVQIAQGGDALVVQHCLVPARRERERGGC
jgi:hypothetical protein